MLLLFLLLYPLALADCTASVTQIYNGFATGNLSAVFAVLGDTITWNSYGSPLCLTTKNYTGLSGAKQYFEQDAMVFNTAVFAPAPTDEWLVSKNAVGVAGLECGKYVQSPASSYCNRFFHLWRCGAQNIENNPSLVTYYEQWQVTQ